VTPGDAETEGQWEVLPAGAMRAKYQLTAENRPVIKLDPALVPPGLRHLIPLAERFGVSDDLIRQDVVAKTPAGEMNTIRQVVEEYNNLFDEWLAGPEAIGPTFSDEYIAFSCLRMATDGC
jgi:hypothetical protein